MHKQVRNFQLYFTTEWKKVSATRTSYSYTTDCMCTFTKLSLLIRRKKHLS